MQDEKSKSKFETWIVFNYNFKGAYKTKRVEANIKSILILNSIVLKNLNIACLLMTVIGIAGNI